MSSIALKLTSLAVRTLAKPIATQIKHQAKEHPQFRHVCIAIAQQLHRMDMRLRLTILRDDTAIQREELAAEAAAKKERKEKEREKEKAREAATAAASLKSSSNPSTVDTPASPNSSISSSNSTTAKQILDQASKKLQDLETASSTSSSASSKPSSSSSSSSSTTSSSKTSSSSSKSSSSGSATPSSSSKKRTTPTPHIRPLSDVKAIERGATFISEAFLFAVAGGLILFEALRSRRKESNRRDIVAERLQTLEEVDEVWRRKVEILERRLDMAGVKPLPARLLLEGTEETRKDADEDPEEGSSSWWSWKRSPKIQEPIKSVHERTATTPLEKYIKHEKDVKKHHEEEVEAKARGLPIRHENSSDKKSSNEELQAKGKELVVTASKALDEASSSALKKT